MVTIRLVPVEEFLRIQKSPVGTYEKLGLISDMCRANTLAAVKRAGSGHLGSSFSAMEIVVWLYYKAMNTIDLGFDSPDRDIYFSSKGHDVPGLYSVLFSLGIIQREKFLKLRRLGGLDGHPDIRVSGIEANSGSLGMGISKGKGMAWAKHSRGNAGRVYVMTGDGEFQEGQIYEALQTTAHHRIDNLTVIVDYNKVQSDKQVCEIIDLGNLEAKLRDFGWHVNRCDGHDFRQLESIIDEFKRIEGRPTILIADTIKGRGVSFMEHPLSLRESNGLYPWHAGAPDDTSFLEAHAEIIARVNARLHSLDLQNLCLEELEPEEPPGSHHTVLLGEPVSQAAEAKIRSPMSDEYVAKAFGQALVELAMERADLVVLDADLASDCRVRNFERIFPERFIENGIAEQDMVSMAGGLAREGFLPVVNSFSSFLASRANEQIYNNATELTKIIYACHYAGLIPAGPGKSHQSIRDISLFCALPNMVILQPCNATEARWVLEYCVQEAHSSCMIRLPIGPSPRVIQLPAAYRLQAGSGVALTEGTDATLFAYGPVMLHESLVASELLAERGFTLSVVNMPWLNRINCTWLVETVSKYSSIYVVEDHAPSGGLADQLANAFSEAGLLSSRRLVKFAIEGYPACGTPPEVLKFHKLDGASLAERILLDQQSFNMPSTETGSGRYYSGITHTDTL